MRIKENMDDLKKTKNKQTNKQTKKPTNKKTGVKSPKQNNCIVNQTIYRPVGA